MRNIFDQYTQPENRLTHALASTLAHDRKLIRPFLRWLGVRDIPPLHTLRLDEQCVPGDVVTHEDDESDGLPDMCIHDDLEWVVLFEAKVQAKVSKGQLARHIKTTTNQGYKVALLVVLAVDAQKGTYDTGQKHVLWQDIYAWFRHRGPKSLWARQFTDYMQVFENNMIAKDYSIRGTITMFDGLHFDGDTPYNYREGKRLIRLLGDKLQARSDLRKLGVNPRGKRRKAITGRGGDRVWDYLPLRAASHSTQFTSFPHLTIDIGRDCVSAAITVPHGVKGGFRSKLRKGGPEGFTKLLLDVHRRLGPTLKRSRDAKPIAYAVQRHFKSQRSLGITDGLVRFDLRTMSKDKSGRVKNQPQWVDAMYNLLANKQSNIQFGLVVEFSYACPIIRSAKATDLFARTWIAQKPLLKFVLK